MQKVNSFKALLIISSISLVYSQSNAQLTYPIVGTGVTVCYGNSAPIACPTNTTDPFYGQDQGTTPSFHDNGDGTISDLITGLIWVKARGSKMSYDSTSIMAGLCATGGFHDWRVPSIKELYSLINFNGKSGITAADCHAYLDTNYFQMAYGPGDTAIGSRTIDAQDWSATRYNGLTMGGDSTVFGVNFVDGRIKGYPKTSHPPTFTPQRMYVRFVRGNVNYGKNKFTDNGNGTISDSATGLMWAKNDNGSGVNWQDALAYAQTKNATNYLGHNDWRVPDTKELESIVDYTRSPMATASAAIDPVFSCSSFSDEGGRLNYPYYWSNTTHLENQFGVYVSFGAALGWMHMPPTATYFKAVDVHGAGAQRSDPKSGSVSTFLMGTDSLGGPCYGLGPQGDVIRINNYVRLVRNITYPSGTGNISNILPEVAVFPNPATNNCTISFAKNYNKINIEVYNSLGVKIMEFNQANSAASTLDLTGLPTGMYLLHITLDGNLSLGRLIRKE